MKKKHIFSTLLIIAASVFLFCEAGRTRKKEISCADLQNEYKDCPLNFEKIKQNGDSCAMESKWLNDKKQRIEFTVDGIRVKIGTERQQIKLRRKLSPDENVVKTQFSHGDKLIRILYTSSKNEGEQMDIYAAFTFDYKGFFIKGSIRGIYQQDKRAKIKDVPEEIFAQTEDRILTFIDTYFI